MRFLGNSEAKTDAKGRVFFPAVFRKQLQTAAEECLILRKDTYQDCLVLYPESVWNEQMNELRSKLNRWNSKHQMIFRQFVSDVEIITLDGNGRFLIPKRYLKLADILCNYQGFKKCVVILVFDAYRVPGSPGSIEQYHNIHIVYTKEAETADMFIEHVTHEIGKDRRVRVATSDGMEQIIILGHGALRVSARMFHEEVKEVEKEIKRYLQGEV